MFQAGNMTATRDFHDFDTLARSRWRDIHNEASLEPTTIVDRRVKRLSKRYRKVSTSYSHYTGAFSTAHNAKSAQEALELCTSDGEA